MSSPETNPQKEPDYGAENLSEPSQREKNVLGLFDSIIDSFEVIELFASPDTAVNGKFAPLKGVNSVYFHDPETGERVKKEGWALVLNTSPTDEFGYQERSIRLSTNFRNIKAGLIGVIGFVHNPETGDIAMFDEHMDKETGLEWTNVLNATNAYLYEQAESIKKGNPR